MPRAVCCLRSFAVAALIGLGTLAPAQAANWLQKSIYMSGANYDGVVPACEVAQRRAQRDDDHGAGV